MVGSGSVLMALSLAWHFGRLRMGKKQARILTIKLMLVINRSNYGKQ
jgi:hypothetical protein